MHYDWSQFFHCGAFIRLEEERLLLAWGPFQSFQEEPSEGISFFHPDFFLRHRPFWYQPKRTAFASVSQTLESLDHFLKEHPFESQEMPPWISPTLNNFTKKFNYIQQAIKGSEIQKAVPFTTSHNQRPPTVNERAYFLRNILTQNENVFPYGFWTPEKGLIGATPETLFYKHPQGKTIETMALAGTRSQIEKINDLPLDQDNKEQREHLLVVEDIISQLSELGQVKKSSTRVGHFSTLSHLQTQIILQTDQPLSFDQLVEKLHPTPALGTFPRQKNFNWIQKLDHGEERESFGAPFGVSLSNEEALCLVAIRNIEWNDWSTSLKTGCGIIKESQLDSEWRELSYKRSAILQSLGLSL